MRKLLILILLLIWLAVPVSAMEFTAPEAPDGALEYMPSNTESFADGLWYVFRRAMEEMLPDISEATGVCITLLVIVCLCSVLESFSGVPKEVVDLGGVLSAGLVLIRSANALVNLGTQTITQVSEYGKLLLPVMSAALAAQGGTGTAAALYTGTVVFNTILTTLIVKLLVPLVYLFLCLSVANHAIKERALGGMQDFVKWLKTWGLKTALYVFTGYIGITKVVSGSTDAAALKATKLVISGAVPVVGNILSDASETVLVGAVLMKNAAGVYGLLALFALCIGPFLHIGIHYLLLKMTSAVCNVFGSKQISGVIKDFSGAMGYILAMTGTVCLILMVSVVCFMKGVG